MDTRQYTFPENYSQRMLCPAEQLILLIFTPTISFKCNEVGMELAGAHSHKRVGCTLQHRILVLLLNSKQRESNCLLSVVPCEIFSEVDIYSL